MDCIFKEELSLDFLFEQDILFDSDIQSQIENTTECQSKIEKYHLEGSLEESFGYEESSTPELSYPKLEIPLFEPQKSFPWNPAEIGHTLVPMSKAKAKKPSDYKNYARNMVNIIISNLRTFKIQLSRFASSEALELHEILYYIDSCKSQFTSVKAIQESWLASQEDSDEEAKCKRVFHRFCAWFLRKKMHRYIIRDGKMRERLEYLKYKNRVMRKGVKNPQLYNSNFFDLLG